MREFNTYSLAAALHLSQVSGADLEMGTVRVHVDFLQSWQACIVEVRMECQTVEDCLSFLEKKGYPVCSGWLPELPVE